MCLYHIFTSLCVCACVRIDVHEQADDPRRVCVRWTECVRVGRVEKECLVCESECVRVLAGDKQCVQGCVSVRAPSGRAGTLQAMRTGLRSEIGEALATLPPMAATLRIGVPANHLSCVCMALYACVVCAGCVSMRFSSKWWMRVSVVDAPMMSPPLTVLSSLSSGTCVVQTSCSHVHVQFAPRKILKSQSSILNIHPVMSSLSLSTYLPTL